MAGELILTVKDGNLQFPSSRFDPYSGLVFIIRPVGIEVNSRLKLIFMLDCALPIKHNGQYEQADKGRSGSGHCRPG